MNDNTSVPVQTAHRTQLRKFWERLGTRLATIIAFTAAFVTVQSTGAFAAPNPVPSPSVGSNAPVDPTVKHAADVVQATALYGGAAIGLVFVIAGVIIMAFTDNGKRGKIMIWAGAALMIVCGGPAVVISVIQSGGQNVLQ